MKFNWMPVFCQKSLDIQDNTTSLLPRLLINKIRVKNREIRYQMAKRSYFDLSQ